jgi:hypothetical protein
MTKIVLTGGVLMDGVGTIETEGLVMTESWGVRWSDEDGRIHTLPWDRIWEVDADPVEPGLSRWVVEALGTLLVSNRSAYYKSASSPG